MIWKGLSFVTNSESPIVVVLRWIWNVWKGSESMEPAFQRGDLLFLTMSSEPIRAGDITVFKIKGKEVPIVHRVIELHDELKMLNWPCLVQKQESSTYWPREIITMWMIEVYIIQVKCGLIEKMSLDESRGNVKTRFMIDFCPMLEWWLLFWMIILNSRCFYWLSLASLYSSARTNDASRTMTDINTFYFSIDSVLDLEWMVVWSLNTILENDWINLTYYTWSDHLVVCILCNLTYYTWSVVCILCNLTYYTWSSLYIMYPNLLYLKRILCTLTYYTWLY
jgi:signal peptidase I